MPGRPVTLRQIAEFAALVAFHGRQLMSSGDVVPDRLLGPYLRHSQERSRQWQSLQTRISGRVATDPVLAAHDLLHLFSEVLVTEMLTRVWTAVLAGSDSEGCRIHGEPIARHVLLGVLQSRADILAELLNGQAYPVGTLLEADVLRRKCDRWTDLLIGELALHGDVSRFAVDPVRSREFRDQSRSSHSGERRISWSLLKAGLSRALPESQVTEPALMAHQGVMAAILETLPASPFDDGKFSELPTAWRLSGPNVAAVGVPPRIAARMQPDVASKLPTSGAAHLLAELMRRIKPDNDVSPPPA